MYAKTLKLHKGSDSRLQFQFLNQEQKPVNITGKEITFRLISYDNNKILLQKSLVNILALTGIAELRTNADDLNNVNTQKCYYSLELPDELGLNVPGLMDKNGTGRGDIDIVNSIYPERIPAQELTLMSYSNTDPEGTYCSSVLATKYTPLITIQIVFTNFVGKVMIQGSTTGTSYWYDIELDDSYDPTAPVNGSLGYPIIGYHPYIRVKFEYQTEEAEVTKIFAR